MLTLAPWVADLAGNRSPQGMDTAYQDFIALDLSGAVPGYCLLATSMPAAQVPTAHTILSDGEPPATRKPSRATSARWTTATGQAPMGDTLADWIVHALSTQSDPSGVSARRPAFPENRSGSLRVNLGRYTITSPYVADRTTDPRVVSALIVLQDEYAAIRADSVPAARQWLRRQQEKYGLSVAGYRLIQGDHDADGPPLPHGTSITESFDTANSTTLGPDQAWTEHVPDFTVASNALAFSQSAHGYCSANVDLGADHYATATLPAGTWLAGPTVRTSATAGTGSQPCCYATYCAQTGSLVRLRKYTSGQTFAEVGSVSQALPGATFTLKLTANGSSLTVALNGANILSATDTTLATPQRCGCFIYSATPRINSWEAGDLSVAGGGGCGRSGCVGIRTGMGMSL